MLIGVPKETRPGEKRVALVPELIRPLKNAGFDVCIQAGAGLDAGFADSEYVEAGASVDQQVLNTAEVILTVCPPTANAIAAIREDSIVIGLLEPYSNTDSSTGFGMPA